MSLFKDNGFKIGFIFMGTVLGAGFASGQEIMRFFCDYGFRGFLGVLFSGVIFFLTGFGILKITYKYKINNSREFLYLIMGKKLGAVFDIISVIFLFLMLAAMLAGGGETIYNIFGISRKSGSLIIAFLIFFVFVAGEDGIGKINTLICPLLLLGVAVLSVSIIKGAEFDYFTFEGDLKKGAFLSAFIYVSYNIITALPVLCGIGNMLNNKATAFKGALIGALGLSVMALFLFLCLALNFNFIKESPIPLLILSKQQGIVFYLIYFVLFLSAVFTTAIGNGFGILKWLEGFGSIGLNQIIILLTGGLLLSELGFSMLVSRIYPLFGVMGVVEILCIIKKAFFNGK